MPIMVYAFQNKASQAPLADLKGSLKEFLDDFGEKASEEGADWMLVGLDLAEIFNKLRLRRVNRD